MLWEWEFLGDKEETDGQRGKLIEIFGVTFWKWCEIWQIDWGMNSETNKESHDYNINSAIRIQTRINVWINN